ncbi:hypothetical protein MC885_007508 [Smutsia gigantea]|nr:hypothetical protein MC885_007508 [Smutsia gigantea]
MGSAGEPGRATWVLAGAILAAALALPAGPGGRGWPPAGPSPLLGSLGAQPLGDPSGAGPQRPAQDVPRMIWPNGESFHFKTARPKKTLFKRESPITHHLYGDILRDVQGTSETGVIFQKCAVVSGQSDWQTAQVQLLVNNPRTPGAANLSDLLLLDNVTGLTIRDSAGEETSGGFQAFRKKFLPAGDSFSVSYTASLKAGAVGSGEVLMLPALLTFQTSSPVLSCCFDFRLVTVVLETWTPQAQEQNTAKSSLHHNNRRKDKGKRKYSTWTPSLCPQGVFVCLWCVGLSRSSEPRGGALVAQICTEAGASVQPGVPSVA